MKITGRLVLALDFGRGRKRKGQQEGHKRYSYRKNGAWFVASSGPTYANTHEVTGFDAEGLAWLEKNERADEPTSNRSHHPPSPAAAEGPKAAGCAGPDSAGKESP